MTECEYLLDISNQLKDKNYPNLRELIITEEQGRKKIIYKCRYEATEGTFCKLHNSSMGSVDPTPDLYKILDNGIKEKIPMIFVNCRFNNLNLSNKKF